MGFSQHCKHLPVRQYRTALALAALGLGLVSGYAQYVGPSATKEKPGPVLRSVAVLEWTGEPGKPSASRLIPVAVFHDGQYEDGGLYLARPEPLALNDGTEYQLMEAGLPQGVFDVYTSLKMSGDWLGYGAWKPLPPPEPVHKLKPSQIPVEVVDGADDRRPHFRKAPPDSGGATPGSTPPEDPDRPTLRKRPDNAPDTSATANPATASAAGNMETVTPGGDPDRPHLTRNGAASQLKKEDAHLDGVPPGLEQMVAISDAADRREHSFRYSWANPDDANKMQAQLTDIALKAIAKASAPVKSAPAKTAPAKPPVHKATSSAHPTMHATTTAHRKPLHPPSPVKLTDVKFKAFALNYAGGATLVLTARTDEPKTKYVTVIAQPDIYGTPQVLFTQVANSDDLDATPQMRLVDAVDAAADNGGELLFELRGNTTRQFAIYRVAGGRIDQMIATGPISMGKPIAD
jgi:hypothetical protein